MTWRDTGVEALSRVERKRDETADDALRTMERLASWLDQAKREDIWRQTLDPIQIAMVYGMLEHLHSEIGALLASGGDEARHTVEAIRNLAARKGSR
jgi:hypothetical protein